jgi:hypothetical protein
MKNEFDNLYTYLTLTTSGSNPGLRVERPVTNRPNHGTDIYIRTYILTYVTHTHTHTYIYIYIYIYIYMHMHFINPS